MGERNDRRTFLKRTAMTGGAILGAGAGQFGFLGRLEAVPISQARLDPGSVQLLPEIAPLVRLLEETPRARLLEEVGARIVRGTTYREVLAALLLAGVRNVQPRPSVGFKFHAVLVVNSAHLASLNAPATDRWLPIFWALDYFKSAQASDEREGDWTLGPVDEAAMPAPHQAESVFLEAMESWDEAKADAAVAALARSAGIHQIYELLFRLGARDFRSIGHKAIFVANSYRTLQCIGWQHAEPVLRSLAYALLMHEGGNPAQRDAEADRPYRRNQERISAIRDEWQGGVVSPEATAELLDALHEGSPQDGSEMVITLLNRGVHPSSIWDGLFNAAGELLMRQPGIVGLHAVTTTNALHVAYQTAADPQARLLAMLQNAAFLPMFREAMGGRGRIRDRKIVEIPASKPPGDPVEAIDAIFEHVGPDRDEAARRTLAYLEAGHDPRILIAAAQRLIFLKGNDAHDYKFSSAALEDYFHIRPDWRDRYLATSMYSLTGSNAQDNQLVARTRAAFEG